MAIVPIQEMLIFLDELGADASDQAAISGILAATESFVSTYCRRVFESTSYTLERYNGRGFQIINLRQYPITAVDRVATGTRNIMTVTNTNTGTSASVSVTSTGLRLVLDGTADETVLFATYATIALVIAAVNALGDGWSATISSSDYSSFKSTDIIQQSASGCINNVAVYLSIPDTGEPEVNVDFERGQIMLTGGFYKGFRNVFVDYTAGYTAANMPEDLKLAVKIIVQFIWEKREQGLFGIDLYNLGASGATGLRVVFEKGSIMPKEAELILSNYRRFLIGVAYD